MGGVTVNARLILYSVIARRALPDVAILFAVLCHAERKRSIYGIAQQSNVSTLREILHYVQNDIVGVRNDVHGVLPLRRFLSSSTLLRLGIISKLILHSA